MTTVSVHEAERRLSTLIHELRPGDEVVIVENDRPIARLVREAPPQESRRLGTLAGSVTYMAPDFDEPLDDFREHME